MRLLNATKDLLPYIAIQPEKKVSASQSVHAQLTLNLRLRIEGI